MATTRRDYYEILGVDRSVPDADITRAVRRLARELHPDVSNAPDADERFKEVVEAYEVLSKSETRQLYDRFGHAGLRSGGLPANGPLGEVRLPDSPTGPMGRARNTGLRCHVDEVRRLQPDRYGGR